MRTFLATISAGMMMACVSLQAIADNTAQISTTELVLASEIQWTQLNPARGDKSPQAATLWGNRRGTVPTGFLVKFVDGFSSPPHIHNVTYRGVVISGLIHNDDPDAAEMWMPTGAFWTQPKGEVHITAAKGSNSVAFIEIDQGPYLVMPRVKAFDSGERPVNVDPSNLVWLDTADITWIEQPSITTAANGAKIAFLWGDKRMGQMSGTFIKLPIGFTGKLQSHGSIFRAVVIQGQPQYHMLDESTAKPLAPGSYFSSKGESVHQLSSASDKESLIYVSTDGKFTVIAAELQR